MNVICTETVVRLSFKEIDKDIPKEIGMVIIPKVSAINLAKLIMVYYGDWQGTDVVVTIDD